MHDMNRRATAVRAVQQRYANRSFRWGSVDCVKVGAWHLRQMGYSLPALGKAGSYRSALSARRALKRAGFEGLGDALDAQGLMRIAPAEALLGDVLLLPGTEQWPSLGIVAGPHLVLGFHEMADGLTVMRIDPTAAEAWRA